MHGPTGHRLPELELPAATGESTDPVAPGATGTVLSCHPGAYAPRGPEHPPGWGEIPGAAGCTPESGTYRDRAAESTARDARVHSVGTQRPDQLCAFAEHTRIPFPLLSDAEFRLTAALRLPTFRAAGNDRLKRLTLVLDATRTVRGVLCPVVDPAGSVEDALAPIDGLAPH
ncbi:redoxin domain-containing protein [Kitasatospora sp. NPDC054795]